MERFFVENTHGVVVIGQMNLAVWEEDEENDEPTMYLFDPSPRGPTGIPTSNGVPCVMRFCNAKMASDHIMATLMGVVDKAEELFVIYPVEMVVGNNKTKRKAKKIGKEEDKSLRNVTCPDKSKVLEQKRVLRAIVSFFLFFGWVIFYNDFFFLNTGRRRT